MTLWILTRATDAVVMDGKRAIILYSVLLPSVTLAPWRPGGLSPGYCITITVHSMTLTEQGVTVSFPVLTCHALLFRFRLSIAVPRLQQCQCAPHFYGHTHPLFEQPARARRAEQPLTISATLRVQNNLRRCAV